MNFLSTLTAQHVLLFSAWGHDMPHVDLPKINRMRWMVGMEIGGSRRKQKVQRSIFGCLRPLMGRALKRAHFVGPDKS
jgi:hypothetical protein